jgi:CheY-like chemotaxis protein
MLDRDVFARYVEEVFGHLDNRPYLLGHPLVALVAAPDQAATPEALRRALISAIEQIRPPEGTPAHLANWRRWRHLTLRYVSGLTTKQIALQLAISERQARRDHELGIGAVAAILWSGYIQRAKAVQPGNAASHGWRRQQSQWSSTAQSELADEATRTELQSAEQETNLGEALDGALATIQGLARARPLTLNRSLSDDLWSVAIRPTMIRQILLCLLTVAIRDDPTRPISIAAHNTSDSVRLTLVVGGEQRPWSDSPGSDERDLLATAQDLAESQGATLTIDATTSATLRLGLSLPATAGIRVLVVDDNPDVAQLFRRFLAGSPYRLVQARTPSTAIALARELRPDVIILDVLMPSQDGWQILQQLRADPITYPIPVIICSILPERSLASSLAAVDFLLKPVTQQSLLAALERSRAPHDPAKHPGSPSSTSSAPQPSTLRFGLR